MEKKIEDYLHLLIGCDVKITGGAIFKLVGILPKQAKPIERGVKTFAVLQHEDSIIEILAYHCKPILRRLDSMTEEEGGMIYMLATNEIDFLADDEWHIVDYKDGNKLVSKGIRNTKRDWWEVNIDDKFNVLKYEDDEEPIITKRHANQHEITRYLLSKSFDLFGLIDSGLAIDASTIKTPTQ